MYLSEVLSHFGHNKSLLARTLGLSRQAVHCWAAEGGRVPELRALQLERMTNGKLKYDPSVYRTKH